MISRFQGEERWLSNFHYCDIEYEGITYPSTEHAYQAMKSNNAKVRKIFSKLEKCGQAKTLGGEIHMREDWDEVKLKIMYDLTRIKFSVEPLKSMLLNTGDMLLVEMNDWNDTFWGICKGKGHNHLGKILMDIRTQLK